MKNKNEKQTTAQLLEELSLCFAPGGFESEMHGIIKEKLGTLCDFKFDKLGSIMCSHKSANASKGNSKKNNIPEVAIFTHIDEVGFMIRGITSGGFLKFVNLGGWSSQTLPSQKVLIRNADGDFVKGIIGMKPPHMLSDEERSKAPKLETLYIDIGAASAEEVEKEYKIELGSPAVAYSDFGAFNKTELYYGKAFDNRAGVCAMIRIMQKLADAQINVKVTGVGSSMEECGLRGAKTAASKLNPDLAIIIDTPPADDTPNNETAYPPQGKIGKGTQVRLFDPTMIARPGLVKYVKKIIESNGIPAQFAVRSSGGTDAGTVHLTQQGIPSIVFGIPTRYIHSHSSLLNINDIETTIELTVKMIKNLSEKQIADF